jgi:GGDEF domain-containing protein
MALRDFLSNEINESISADLLSKIKSIPEEDKKYGNCGVFAIALKRFLGKGDYIAVSGDNEPEYFYHVALLVDGKYIDGDGIVTKSQLFSYVDDGKPELINLGKEEYALTKFTEPTKSAEYIYDKLNGINEEEEKLPWHIDKEEKEFDEKPYLELDRKKRKNDIELEIQRRQKRGQDTKHLETALEILENGKLYESEESSEESFDIEDELDYIYYKIEDERLKKRLKKVMDNLPKSDKKECKSSGDLRNIIKFKDNGEIYYKEIKGVHNVKALMPVLKERVKDNPIIVAGDLSGLGDLNNFYGREAADDAIEKSLELFSKMMKEHGTVASPSGDEIWFLPNKDVEAKDIAKLLTEYLKKLNSIEMKAKNVETKKEDTFGLNAKFYIGRKTFDDVEASLKFMPNSEEKVPPGTIKVEGELWNEEGEKIYPTHKLGVSKLPRPPIGKDSEVEHSLKRDK